MSVKDTRYYRRCPICEDQLIGTDDGIEVYESIVAQVEEGVVEPNCTLCGQECTTEKAKDILSLGTPHLFNKDGSLADPIS